MALMPPDLNAGLTPQVLVWGGGSGGVAAALQAARSGADTLLLTPASWLGGMLSAAGVCAPDGNELSPWQSGLWGALLRALEHREPSGLDHNWVSCFGFRPRTAETILQEWVAAEPRLRWWPGCRLLDVRRQGDRISAVRVQVGPEGGTNQGERPWIEPQLVIDGSDRGDLFPLAEAPFRLGWEAAEDHGEPSAPSRERLTGDPFFRRQPVQSPTWVVMGQLDKERLPAPAEPPDLAEPFQQACSRFGLERTLTYGRLPGGLVMLNWPLCGNDWHEGLERAFSGDALQDNALERAMQAHSLAFLATLEQACEGALVAGDAFPGALALMPYWREGRRLVGRDLVLEQHLLPQGEGASIAALPLEASGAIAAIAVGNYANDHHYPGGDWPLAPKSCRWGGRWSGTPFALPYGALVSATVSNLLAADKCLSVSHMANGATRLQPLVLNIGQAAGLAAALCLRHGCTPAELPVRTLQEALIDDRLAPASPVPLWDTPWHHPQRRKRQKQVLDDPSLLSPTGTWMGPAQPGHQPPASPHERLWQGELRPDGQGGYRLRVSTPSQAEAGRDWPLITLEPELHQWLLQLDGPRSVRLIAHANPWGPWLRASRLAD
ncbi:FAD-dependent oxidoreductase [Synechococcus sp. CCY9201]|uniref:FAD-dependent oxidoreductase n=1 Tax=Synechococcus sp. CCY9201 TaxID=174697 RepID=UPI002B21A17E|nr:FAD-dependent oxidoreductase [Synechococcus sp. CCY9201]